MDAARTSPPDELESAFLALRPDLVRRARAIDPGGDAEDAVQDVWLRLRAVRRPVDDPRAYLMRMVYSAVLDRRRSLRRAAARDGRWTTAHRPGGEEGAPPDAEDLVLARERLAAIDARLLALGEPGNTIFRRYRFGGESQKGISTDLKVSLSTVEKHLQRAYAAIHRFRGDHDD